MKDLEQSQLHMLRLERKCAMFLSVRPHGKLCCFLLLLASSVLCYVMVTSSGALVGSNQRHASFRPVPVDPKTAVHNFRMPTGGPPMQQNATSENQTKELPYTITSENETESHHLIPKNGKIPLDSSLTSNLWNFKNITDEQLYLYENLLKQTWTPNITKTDNLRLELAKFRSELEGSSQVLLHRENTKSNSKIKFVFTDKDKVISSTLFKRLPKNNPLLQGKRYRSCAVVGNSGIMLNSNCGTDIDKHDYVFRCNLAPLAPFKKDAGMKSNFTTMNPSMVYRKYQQLVKTKGITQFNKDISQYDGVIWVPCYSMFSSLGLVMKAFTSYKGKKPLMVCGNPKHFRSVVDFWVERELNSRLSSGFFLVTTAIQLCDEVHVYGFWPFSSRYGDKKLDVPYHYFDDLQIDNAKSTHSMDKEFSMLVQLHTLGSMRLNVGSCS